MIKVILSFKGMIIKEIKSTDREITIGRDMDNVIQIDNLAVSKHHAQITYRNGKYFIEDLFSTNGTFIDEKPVHLQELKDGQEIIIGKHTLKISFEKTVNRRPVLNYEDMDKTMVLETKDHEKMLAKLLAKFRK